MILKLKTTMVDENRKELQEKLSKEWNTTVYILPANLDIVMQDTLDG